MYTILGGDLAKIQDNSDLEQLQSKNDDQLQRGRGRPKKYTTTTHIAVNSTQKKLRRFEENNNYTYTSLAIGGKLKKKSHLCNNWYKYINTGGKTTVVGVTILRNNLKPRVR